MAKWKQIKGTCLLCGRTRKAGNSVLSYKKIKYIETHFLKCSVCGTIWSAPNKEGVMDQHGPTRT